MPQPQIHRHEKPPIPWTSIPMSKKREAVQDEAGAFCVRGRVMVAPCGCSGAGPVLLVAGCCVLVLCPKRSPLWQIMVKTRCLGHSGLHFGRGGSRCGVLGGTRGGWAVSVDATKQPNTRLVPAWHSVVGWFWAGSDSVLPVPCLSLCVGVLHPIRRQCTSSEGVQRP